MDTPGERAARDELERRVESTTRIVLRPLAGPLALGFLGLAAATFVRAGLELGWVEPAEGKKVALIAIAFTVPLQFTASLIGFLARDGVAATGMGLLSGIWLALGLVTYTSPPGSTSDALGLFLVVGAVAMWIPAGSAALSKLVPALVLGTAGLRFLVTGVYQLTGVHGWEDAAGVIGLALAVLAVYAALATELEDVLKRTVLPLGRRGKGAQALNGVLYDQVAQVQKEPGVRLQL
jgi:succinate-acetate transporter protein